MVIHPYGPRVEIKVTCASYGSIRGASRSDTGNHLALPAPVPIQSRKNADLLLYKIVRTHAPYVWCKSGVRGDAMASNNLFDQQNERDGLAQSGLEVPSCETNTPGHRHRYRHAS